MPRRLSRRARRLRRQSALPLWCLVTVAALMAGLAFVAANTGGHPAERSVGVAAIDAGADDNNAVARAPFGPATVPAVLVLAVAWIVAAVIATSHRHPDAPSTVVARLRGPPLVSFVPMS